MAAGHAGAQQSAPSSTASWHHYAPHCSSLELLHTLRTHGSVPDLPGTWELEHEYSLSPSTANRSPPPMLIQQCSYSSVVMYHHSLARQEAPKRTRQSTDTATRSVSSPQLEIVACRFGLVGSARAELFLVSVNLHGPDAKKEFWVKTVVDFTDGPLPATSQVRPPLTKQSLHVSSHP